LGKSATKITSETFSKHDDAWIWIWIIIANLLTDISAMECARLRAVGHDIADR